MPARTLPVAYFVLQLLGGHVGLPLLILTFLLSSKRVPRHPTIVNLCIAWAMYSVTYCLLLYGGNNFKSNPPKRLCAVQAAMVHGAPCMAVVAVFVVVLKIWSTVYEPWQVLHLHQLPRWSRLCVMLLPPYVTFAIFSVAAGVVGARHPETIYVSNSIYCTIDNTKLYWAVPLFTAIILLGISCFEVAAMARYLKGWRDVKKLCPDAKTRAQEISPWIRAATFVLNSWLALGVCISFMARAQNPTLYIVQAVLPLAAFFICGIMQRDILMAWFSDCKGQGCHETCPEVARQQPNQSPSDSVFVAAGNTARPSPILMVSIRGASPLLITADELQLSLDVCP